jgi:glycosyltransferase involved in cell wall biosynthesis
MSAAKRAVDADEGIDAAARREFAHRHGEADFGPVCIVIAAYREATSLGEVVAALPGEVHGLDVSVLVVDDGSDDGTADVARAHGAFACISAVNRGQGAALRLGYELATEHGARYLVTTDADGQYDPAEIPALLEPIVANRADFVTGSRRLGSTYRGDGVRRLGVVFYATVIRVLTGQRITDPSFGLRAMRVEVPAAVTLRQPQFQASELLIGAAMQGFRIAEVPGVMRRRTAGKSRKGPDLVYGARFGWVVVSTWWRERDRRPR